MKHQEAFERLLDRLIDPNECVDTYDRTYIDDLQYILIENHGFDFATQKFVDKTTQLLFDRTCAAFKFNNMEEMIAYLKDHLGEIDLANFRPRVDSEIAYEEEPSFNALERGGESIERSNEFQLQWSLRGIKALPTNDQDADIYELYLSYDRVNPWSYLIRREIARGNLSPDDQVLCLGNRWLGEILYFRENLGLKRTRGVDLFTSNSDLVVQADMHRLPFEDNSVKLIFARGAVNKSYDVRLLANEMMRVLKDDGFIAIDQQVYPIGLDRLGRTDLKSSTNLLRLFRGKALRIIYTDEMDGARDHRYGFHESVRSVRVFIQLDKNGINVSPQTEAFSGVAFSFYDRLRRYIRRRKVEKRLKVRFPKALKPAHRPDRPSVWSHIKSFFFVIKDLSKASISR